MTLNTFARTSLCALALCLALSPLGVGATQLGVYRWEAPLAPANVDAFEVWLGRPVALAEAFEARDTWDNIDGAAWQLGPWSQWVRAKSGRNLVLGVPMMPGEPDRSGPDGIRGTADDVSLEQCAAGRYDVYWRNLANELTNYGLHWAYLRLGWEMDGSWYAWAAPQGSGREASFGGCFRRIVQVMRSAQPANQWKFVWNPTATWSDPAYLNATWPGDAYVDVVGIDLYDHSWAPNTYPYPAGCDSACRLARQQTAWNHYAWYLQTVRSFALARGKAFAIPEWGLYTRTDSHGGGDNPYYIQKMHEYISNPANAVLFHVYFDVNSPDGDHHISGLDQPTTFPQSAAMFRQLFGAASAGPAPGTPTVYFTAPAEGGVLKGNVQGPPHCIVEGTNIARVMFYINGVWTNTDGNLSNGLGCWIDTTKYKDGAYTLRAVAYNAAGQTASTERAIVIQNNVAASTPGAPTVYFTAPAEGGVLNGNVQGPPYCIVEGTNIARVMFYINGVWTNTDGNLSNGLGCWIDTTKYDDGPYTLRAVAYNAAGQTATTERAIVIQNSR